MVPQLALGFAIVAGAARWLLPLTYSRLQVIAFVFAALAVELVAKPVAGRRPSLAGFCLNAAAATLAVVAVKCGSKASRWPIGGASWPSCSDPPADPGPTLSDGRLTSL